MSERKPKDAYEKLGRALDRLGEVLERDVVGDDLLRDAAIQRFEFTFELFWKALKADMEARGKKAGAFPLDVFQSAYVAGWIDGEDDFRKMLKDRNRTSHAYDEALAIEIAERLPTYYQRMRAAYEHHPYFK